MVRHNLSIFNSKIKENIFFYLKITVILIIYLTYFFKEISPQYTQDYMGSLQDKMDRLENIDEPKIVLVGNSNLAFGMDSELLECAFGMPVVNTGLHGGLGSEFSERVVLDNIGRGDIVIICNMYNSDKWGNYFDPLLTWVTLENHWDLYKLLPKNEYLNFIKGFPAYMKKSINLWLEDNGNIDTGIGCYRRSAFNEYGDIEVGRMGETYEFTDGSVYDLEISDKRMESINQLNDWILKQGGTLLVAGWPLALTEEMPDEMQYEELQNKLEEKLQCEIISDITNYIFDRKYFYDTIYHLNDEGTVIRTLQLIEDLERWSNQNGNVLKKYEIPAAYCFQNKGFYDEENDGTNIFRWGRSGADIILLNTLDVDKKIKLEADVRGINEGTMQMLLADDMVSECTVEQTWKHIEVEFILKPGENDIIILCDAINVTEDIRDLSFSIKNLQIMD